MDEYLNNRHKEIFLRLLTNPADTGGVYLANLQELVNTYPQSGLLRAMYGRALNEEMPVVAAGYFNNNALHKLLYNYDSLLAVNNNQIVIEGDVQFGTASAIISKSVHESAAVATPDLTDIENERNMTDRPIMLPDVFESDNGTEKEDLKSAKETLQPSLIETVGATPDNKMPSVEEEPLGRAPWEIEDEDEIVGPAPNPNTERDISQAIAPVVDPVKEQPAISANADNDETAVKPDAKTEPEVIEQLPVNIERTPWDLIAEEYASQARHTDGQNTEINSTPAITKTHINDEVYDEITGIDDINITRLTASAMNTETPAPGIGNTNYFSFDDSFTGNRNDSPVILANAAPEVSEPVAREGLQLSPYQQQEVTNQPNNVSKYHDEKMPYTFMWWLDKTRKEHDVSYQPYISGPDNYTNHDTPGKREKNDELQQQYFENIFHLSPMDSITNIDEPQTVEFDMQVKEDRIIKRFITEDPHIHPPLGERLDTENKAKKSSEDDFEMVTETLARIYADQMLFPKAIATYRKLMLKFPEKIRYFASRIDALEKRTN